MVELVTALEQAHRESPSWRLYGLCHQAATRITELEAENERLREQITKATDPTYLEEKLRQIGITDEMATEALSRTGAVKVKPLEWEDADEGMCTKWRAAALGGHYELVDFGKDDPGFAVNFHWGRPLSFWFIQGEPDERGPTGPKIFPTLKAAKAAAQADYERRILSALTTGPAAPEDQQEPMPRNVIWFGFDENTGEFTGEYCSVKPADARGMRPYIPYTARPSEQAVTDAMVEAVRKLILDDVDVWLSDDTIRGVLKAAMEAEG